MSPEDRAFGAAIATAVAELERTTDAEIVVVLAGRSDGYEDVPLLVGIGVGLTALVALLFVPFEFPPWSVPFLVAVAGVLGGLVVGRFQPLTRALTSDRRRRAQVAHSAAAAFHREAIAGTRRRTGVLLYASRLERLLVVIPDVGVTRCVAPGEIYGVLGSEIADMPTTTEGFVALLQRLGSLLAERVPATAENPDELPDAPRFLP